MREYFVHGIGVWDYQDDRSLVNNEASFMGFADGYLQDKGILWDFITEDLLMDIGPRPESAE